MANATESIGTRNTSGGGAGRILRGILLHTVLFSGSLLMALPFLWMVLTSFKPFSQVYQVPPTWIPDPFTVQSYINVWDAVPVGSGYVNSLIVTLSIVVAQLLTCSMAAYAFAKIEFPFRDTIFILFLATLMIPFQSTIIPLYIIMREIGWIDTLQAIIVPNALFNAFGIFLLRQFIMGIPNELEEAAIVDGANRWTVYWRIVLPLIRPALSAFGIFTFLFNWNDFFRPLIFLDSQEKFTLPLVLNQLRGQYATDWTLVMAGSTLAVVPILIVFIIGQRQIIEGIAVTGLKR
jgi:multiple sugar transport system permease protein